MQDFLDTGLAESLIKRIYYPDVFKFSFAATEHGCQHEQTAVLAFEKAMKSQNINFRVEKGGLVINKEYLLLQATADFF